MSFKKICAWCAGGITFFVALGLAVMANHIFFPQPYPKDFGETQIPTFSLIPLDFKHEYSSKTQLPLLGSVIFDADNDGIKEIILGGGEGQADGFFTYKDSDLGFVRLESNFLKKPNTSATYGMAAIDATGDGLTDIFIARTDGITLYTNLGNRKFSGEKLNIKREKNATPVSLSLTDLNQDGFVDIFVSQYLQKFAIKGYTIFNDKTYGVNDMLLLNNGDNTFKDITKSAGLEYIHNTFVSVWSDIDLDQDPDLILAHDTGQVRMYRNNGDLTFTFFENPNSDAYSYPMGIAVGDTNNDTYPDFFFSNTGKTVPGIMARGDLEDDQLLDTRLLLFENDMNGNFNDVSDEKKIADYEFSWGAAMADFNLDGLEDIVVTESYVGFPLHNIFKLPGRLLLQKIDGTFVAAEKEAGVINRAYGITPLIGDFDNDGDEDLIHINLDGEMMACINDKTLNNWIKVNLPETAKSLGARAVLKLYNGKTVTQYFTSGEGLSSDQSHELVFGLGQEKNVPSITIFYLDGTETLIENPTINTSIKVRQRAKIVIEEIE